MRQGGIYQEMLEEADAIKADLIVMSSHRPAMRTYFLGSNAGHVVRYAKCSVLVVQALGAWSRPSAEQRPVSEKMMLEQKHRATMPDLRNSELEQYHD